MKNKNLPLKVSVIIAILGVLIGFQNCSNARLQTTNAAQSIFYSSTENVIKPALAVRAIGCVMCHGIVVGDIVTDFGYGSPFFFGRYQNLMLNSTPQSASWQNTAYGNWGGIGRYVACGFLRFINERESLHPPRTVTTAV
jgi:hypothetical protein